jgi:hypothetical protein
VAVWNRSAEKAAPHIQAGAILAPSTERPSTQAELQLFALAAAAIHGFWCDCEAVVKSLAGNSSHIGDDVGPIAATVPSRDFPNPPSSIETHLGAFQDDLALSTILVSLTKTL